MAVRKLSQSQITSFLLCPEYYRRERIEGDFLGLKTVSLARGSGVHKGAEANFSQKKDSRVDLPREEIVEVSAEHFDRTVNDSEGFGLWLSPDEKSQGKKKTVGDEKDRTVRLAKLLADDYAPTIQPSQVEAFGEVEVVPDRLEFRGYIDVIVDGVVRDLKTSTKKKNPGEVAKDFQLTSYAVLYTASVGEFPKGLSMDVLIDKKAREVQTLATIRDREDVEAWLNTVVAVFNMIEAGTFPPAPMGSWKCAPKWCPAFSDCRFVSKSADRRLAGLWKG